MAGIYVHIPFCRSRCRYCDFHSGTDLSLAGPLTAALEREITLNRCFLADEPVHTLYFGGGTPSLLPLPLLDGIYLHIGRTFGTEGYDEATIEANPDDITPDWAEWIRAAGFDRLSIGIQSFDDGVLTLMNRRHTSAEAAAAVRTARDAGFGNISIDLMYGIPGVDDDLWRRTLERAISLDVEHISAYHLTIEEGTVFGRWAATGKLTAVNERTSIRQFELLHDMLGVAGFEHYEVSNFARPGFRAKHNSSYWDGTHYLGIGPAAHSFNGAARRWTDPDTGKYIRGSAHGFDYTQETLSGTDIYNEFVMTRLRTADGIRLCELWEKFGQDTVEKFLHTAGKLLPSGDLVRDRDTFRIPSRRFLTSDSVIRSFFR